MIELKGENKEITVNINIYDKRNHCLGTIESSLKNILNNSHPEEAIWEASEKITDRKALYEIFEKASYFEVRSNNEVIMSLIDNGSINITSIKLQPDRLKVSRELGEDGKWYITTDIIEDPELLKPSKEVYSKEIYDNIMEEDNK